mmetsp:Transcript_18626/g.33329  ORF Transcript_18626/g.33329 Transcript_18626/m.33329 type:complete len:236 (-) Transcript_18626:291-998(-)
MEASFHSWKHRGPAAHQHRLVQFWSNRVIAFFNGVLQERGYAVSVSFYWRMPRGTQPRQHGRIEQCLRSLAKLRCPPYCDISTIGKPKTIFPPFGRVVQSGLFQLSRKILSDEAMLFFNLLVCKRHLRAQGGLHTPPSLLPSPGKHVCEITRNVIPADVQPKRRRYVRLAVQYRSGECGLMAYIHNDTVHRADAIHGEEAMVAYVGARHAYRFEQDLGDLLFVDFGCERPQCKED